MNMRYNQENKLTESEPLKQCCVRSITPLIMQSGESQERRCEENKGDQIFNAKYACVSEGK